MKHLMHKVLLGVLVFLLVPCALLASGFSVYEQSAKASGQAGAWVARADDAAANWYNPAALVWLEESEFQFGGNLITAGGDTEFTVNDPRFGVITPTTFDAEDNLATPIHLYYSHKASDRFAWGIGVTTPFGLVTEWGDRPVTFSAVKSELTTFVINPNFAFKLGDGGWAGAVGLDYIYADISEFSREVPARLAPPQIIGFSDLTGDGDDIGFNAALSYRGDKWSFGLSYRSELSPEIDGEIEFSGFGPLQPFFQNSTGTAPLDLPAQLALGFAGELSESWSWEFDVAYAGWSSFERLEVDIDNENPPFVTDISLLEDWDDTFSYRLGAAWAASESGEWRFGVVFDESPVPETTLRPSIPDSDRTGLTVGYGYKGNKWSVDGYYMALFFDDIEAVGSEEGLIRGEYSTFVHLAGLTFSRRF